MGEDNEMFSTIDVERFTDVINDFFIREKMEKLYYVRLDHKTLKYDVYLYKIITNIVYDSIESITLTVKGTDTDLNIALENAIESYYENRFSVTREFITLDDETTEEFRNGKHTNY